MKRQKVKMAVIKPHETGLECPLCGCKALSRDTSPAGDGWYVEWCSGILVIELMEPDNGRLITVRYEFECPYVAAGFKK